MWIQRLQLEGFRNLDHIDLEFVPGLNLIFGGNGAGKTSLLEAIYFFDRGNTFRGKKIGPIRSINSDYCSVQLLLRSYTGHSWRGRRFCPYSNQHPIIGIESFTSKPNEFMIRLISDSIYLLVEGQPDLRRRFIDWNLFHVKPSYAKLLTQFRRISRQRSAWLRSGAYGHPIWDQPFVDLSLKIEQERHQFCDLLRLRFDKQLAAMGLKNNTVGFKWSSGFNQETLLDGLKQFLDSDKKRGFTFLSPDRSDMKLYRCGQSSIGSRGENKMIAVLLQLAASHLTSTEKPTDIYLVDDLGSDLSNQNSLYLLEMIRASASQVLMTSLEPSYKDVDKCFSLE